ncbi:MAG TPA: Zn-dependent hydrolase [Candidatus Polarisedimenticolia bacterium]|nr:Zn-dependent hydrolase [Candidatus Polarisedimenticolia bacterium]
MKSLVVLLLLAPALVSLISPLPAAEGPAKDEKEIRERLKAYAEVRLRADLSGLSARERDALAKIVAAVNAVDAIYWKQMGRQSLEARQAFAGATDPVDLLYQRFIAINYGPFDIRKDMERFIRVGTDGGPRLPGAGFYPEEMTKEEFEARLKAHPELRDEFERLNTLIRRVDGTLVAIPYEKVYLDDLSVASRALSEAAASVDSPSLRRYLSLRAEALIKGDFYASDLAWLDVKDNLLDVVIGPIETYDDALLGLRASYEGAAMIKDAKESRALDVYKRELDGLSRALPVEERFRKASAGSGNVLEVVNIVRFSGDFNAGIKTVAASLPNDERVIQEKGAKKQIYKNVLEAKFETILTPIAALFLPKKDLALVTREAFVTNVLLHELSHTLGVDYVAGSKELTVRKALKERYSAIEESKADVVGLYNLQYLHRREIFNDDEVAENYATYLAGIFRAIRFGAEEAHGQGTAVQLNFLMKEGGIDYDAKKGEFSIHPRKFEPALTKLAKELLEIEGTGDYARAGALLETYGRLDASTREALKRTEAVPVDVVFTYPM